MKPDSRRRFLKVVATGGAAAAFGCGAETDSTSSSSSVELTSGVGGSSQLPEGPTGIGNVTSLPEGALLGIANLEVMVGRDAAGVYAMTSRCSHQNCNMLGNDGIFPGEVICGCHNSHFDYLGHPVSGPAKTRLSHFLVEIDSDGELTIDRGVIVDGDDRAPVT